VKGLDPDRKLALLSDGSAMPFDLFLGVPVHRVPAVVEESGLTVDGWVPVDPRTLETAFPGVYAVGDVASVGIPRRVSSPKDRPRSSPGRSVPFWVAVRGPQAMTVAACVISRSAQILWPALRSPS